MKYLLAIIAITLSFSTQAQNTEFENNIRKMLEATGVERNFAVLIPRLIEMEKESNPNIPVEFWDRFQQKMLDESMQEVYDALIPIYKKHLTEADVQGIMEFYSTPAGKSLIEKTPMIMQESMTVGGELGKRIALKVTEELVKELEEQ